VNVVEKSGADGDGSAGSINDFSNNSSMSEPSTTAADLALLDDRAPAWSRYSVVGIFLTWLAMIWLWPFSIYTLTVDDSYYYLKTAENAASGYGFTFDQINPTNGFHPLWMMILVPLSYVSGGNMDVFARLAMTLQLAMVYGGSVLLSRAIEDRRRWLVLATALLMLNFYYAKIVINALEGGVQWFLLCATLFVTLHLLKRDSRTTNASQFFALGLLAGLTVLSRLTSVLFIGGVGLLILIITWQSSDDHAKLRSVCRRLIPMALGIILPLIPYLVWSFVSSGHFTPVSAAIKTSREYTLTHTSWIVSFGLLGMWLGSCLMLWRSSQSDHFSRYLVWSAFPLFTYAVLQEMADILFCGALISEIWYMVPQAILTAALGGAVFRQGGLRGGLWRLTSYAACGLLLLFAICTWAYRLDPRSYASYLTARHTADWIREHTKPDDIVAGWDVGIIGGYADRRVANLDGLINSWDYKQNYLDKKLIDHWITDICKVDYLAQEFWAPRLTPEVLRNFNGVDLLKWKVVYHDSAMVRSWSNLGHPVELYNLVLTRTGDGKPLEEFLRDLNLQPSSTGG
jgi:hypothetical protein